METRMPMNPGVASSPMIYPFLCELNERLIESCNINSTILDILVIASSFITSKIELHNQNLYRLCLRARGPNSSTLSASVVNANPSSYQLSHSARSVDFTHRSMITHPEKTPSTSISFPMVSGTTNERHLQIQQISSTSSTHSTISIDPTLSQMIQRSSQTQPTISHLRIPNERQLHIHQMSSANPIHLAQYNDSNHSQTTMTQSETQLTAPTSLQMQSPISERELQVHQKSLGNFIHPNQFVDANNNQLLTHPLQTQHTGSSSSQIQIQQISSANSTHRHQPTEFNQNQMITLPSETQHTESQIVQLTTIEKKLPINQVSFDPSLAFSDDREQMQEAMLSHSRSQTPPPHRSAYLRSANSGLVQSSHTPGTTTYNTRQLVQNHNSILQSDNIHTHPSSNTQKPKTSPTLQSTLPIPEEKKRSNNMSKDRLEQIRNHAIYKEAKKCCKALDVAMCLWALKMGLQDSDFMAMGITMSPDILDGRVTLFNAVMSPLGIIDLALSKKDTQIMKPEILSKPEKDLKDSQFVSFCDNEEDEREQALLMLIDGLIPTRPRLGKSKFIGNLPLPNRPLDLQKYPKLKQAVMNRLGDAGTSQPSRIQSLRPRTLRTPYYHDDRPLYNGIKQNKRRKLDMRKKHPQTKQETNLNRIVSGPLTIRLTMNNQRRGPRKNAENSMRTKSEIIRIPPKQKQSSPEMEEFDDEIVFNQPHRKRRRKLSVSSSSSYVDQGSSISEIEDEEPLDNFIQDDISDNFIDHRSLELNNHRSLELDNDLDKFDIESYKDSGDEDDSDGNNDENDKYKSDGDEDEGSVIVVQRPVFKEKKRLKQNKTIRNDLQTDIKEEVKDKDNTISKEFRKHIIFDNTKADYDSRRKSIVIVDIPYVPRKKTKVVKKQVAKKRASIFPIDFKTDDELTEEDRSDKYESHVEPINDDNYIVKDMHARLVELGNDINHAINDEDANIIESTVKKEHAGSKVHTNTVDSHMDNSRIVTNEDASIFVPSEPDNHVITDERSNFVESSKDNSRIVTNGDASILELTGVNNHVITNFGESSKDSTRILTDGHASFVGTSMDKNTAISNEYATVIEPTKPKSQVVSDEHTSMIDPTIIKEECISIDDNAITKDQVIGNEICIHIEHGIDDAIHKNNNNNKEIEREKDKTNDISNNHTHNKDDNNENMCWEDLVSVVTPCSLLPLFTPQPNMSAIVSENEQRIMTILSNVDRSFLVREYKSHLNMFPPNLPPKPADDAFNEIEYWGYLTVELLRSAVTKRGRIKISNYDFFCVYQSFVNTLVSIKASKIEGYPTPSDLIQFPGKLQASLQFIPGYDMSFSHPFLSDSDILLYKPMAIQLIRRVHGSYSRNEDVIFRESAKVYRLCRIFGVKPGILALSGELNGEKLTEWFNNGQDWARFVQRLLSNEYTKWRDHVRNNLNMNDQESS